MVGLYCHSGFCGTVYRVSITLEIVEISWNLMALPGNFCVTDQSDDPLSRCAANIGLDVLTLILLDCLTVQLYAIFPFIT